MLRKISIYFWVSLIAFQIYADSGPDNLEEGSLVIESEETDKIFYRELLRGFLLRDDTIYVEKKIFREWLDDLAGGSTDEIMINTIGDSSTSGTGFLRFNRSFINSLWGDKSYELIKNSGKIRERAISYQKMIELKVEDELRQAGATIKRSIIFDKMLQSEELEYLSGDYLFIKEEDVEASLLKRRWWPKWLAKMPNRETLIKASYGPIVVINKIDAKSLKLYDESSSTLNKFDAIYYSDKLEEASYNISFKRWLIAAGMKFDFSVNSNILIDSIPTPIYGTLFDHTLLIMWDSWIIFTNFHNPQIHNLIANDPDLGGPQVELLLNKKVHLTAYKIHSKIAFNKMINFINKVEEEGATHMGRLPNDNKGPLEIDRPSTVAEKGLKKFFTSTRTRITSYSKNLLCNKILKGEERK